MWVASDMAIDFRLCLLTGEDTEIATALKANPRAYGANGRFEGQGQARLKLGSGFQYNHSTGYFR